MEYGILVVESDDLYEIIGAVSSKSEGIDKAKNYIHHALANPDDGGFIPPETMVIQRRDGSGWYSKREMLTDAELQ